VSGTTGGIVLGFDGSEGAKAALTEALVIAKALGASIRLAFGFEPPAFYAGEPTGQRDAIEEIGNTTLQEGLDLAKATDASVEVTAETVAGRPADALIAMAERDHARMIVVGHHGGSTVMGAILGSVTFKVLQTAPCPVLVVSAEG